MYIQEMWGTTEKLAPVKINKKAQKGEMEEILTGSIRLEELRGATRKLKKHKAPGEDMIPNEVWMELQQIGEEKVVALLEGCRMDNSFPEQWGITEIRYTRKETQQISGTVGQ